MQTVRRHPYAVLILLSAFLFLLGNSLVPVTDTAEANYALTSKEMVLSGDWLSPQIYGRYWYDKPIFYYWMLSASFPSSVSMNSPPASPPPFSARCPYSSPSGSPRKSMTKRPPGARRSFSRRALNFSSSPKRSSPTRRSSFSCPPRWRFSILATRKPEMVLGLLGCRRARVPHERPHRHRASRPLVRSFPPAEKDLKEMLHVHLFSGFLLFLLLGGSWYYYMYLRHGSDFLVNFFGVHNYLRAVVPEHERQNVWYFYIMMFFAGFAPWSFGLLWSLRKSSAASANPSGKCPSRPSSFCSGPPW